MTSPKLYSNLKTKFKIYYVTFVNIRALRKRRIAKNNQNQIIFMDSYNIALKTLPNIKPMFSRVSMQIGELKKQLCLQLEQLETKLFLKRI